MKATGNTVIFYIFISIVGFSLYSCTSNVGTRENVNRKSSNDDLEVEVETKIEKPAAKNELVENEQDFNFGTWRIDSVAENNVVKSRLIRESKIQIFNFRKEGVFSAMEVSGGTTNDRPLGNWKITGDSVYIFNEAGKGMMRYKYTNVGKMLVLNGNFQISPKNPNKPTFYLSKYK